MATSKKIALVGNARSACGFGPLIDAHDLVVRFNLTPYYGCAGYRTDLLVLHNTGLSAQRLATGQTTLHAGALRSVREVCFTMDPETISWVNETVPSNEDPFGRIDYSGQISTLAGSSLQISKVPKTAWLQCRVVLSHYGALPSQYPSSGAVALQWLIQRCPDAQFTMFGFTHKGWDGHAWDAERAWMHSLSNVRFKRWSSVASLAWAQVLRVTARPHNASSTR